MTATQWLPTNANTPYWGSQPGFFGETRRQVLALPQLRFPDAPQTLTWVRRCGNAGDPNPWRLATWAAPMREVFRVNVEDIPHIVDRRVSYAQQFELIGQNQWEDHLLGAWMNVRMRFNAYDAAGYYVAHTPISTNWVGSEVLVNQGQWIAPGDQFSVSNTCSIPDWSPLTTPTWGATSNIKKIALLVGCNLSISASMMTVDEYSQSNDRSKWVWHTAADMLMARQWFGIVPNPFGWFIEDQLRSQLP